MNRALLAATLALVPAAAVAASCRAKATEVMVVVDSDFAVPAEIDEIVIEVRGRDGFTRSFDGGLTGASALPATVEVEATDPAEPFTVIVGARSSGRLVLERRIDTGFIAEESRAIEMMLCRECLGVACASDETCTEHGCAKTTVPATELPPWSGLPPPRPPCGSNAGDGGGDVDARSDSNTANDGEARSCVPQAQIDADGGVYTLDTCEGGTAIETCDSAGRRVQGALAGTPQSASEYHITVASGRKVDIIPVDGLCVKAAAATCGGQGTTIGPVPGGLTVFIAYMDEPCGKVTFTVTPP